MYQWLNQTTGKLFERPRCSVDNCDNPVHLVNISKLGVPQWRKICGTHHTQTWHPSLRHRKTACDNQDGRLGFRCTTTVIWPGMLDVDHIDGDPSNQHPSNYQTLCKCCHAYKTWKQGDSRTPGRKTLGVKY